MKPKTDTKYVLGPDPKWHVARCPTCRDNHDVFISWDQKIKPWIYCDGCKKRNGKIKMDVAPQPSQMIDEDIPISAMPLPIGGFPLWRKRKRNEKDEKRI